MKAYVIEAGLGLFFAAVILAITFSLAVTSGAAFVYQVF